MKHRLERRLNRLREKHDSLLAEHRGRDTLTMVDMTWATWPDVSQFLKIGLTSSTQNRRSTVSDTSLERVCELSNI